MFCVYLWSSDISVWKQTLSAEPKIPKWTLQSKWRYTTCCSRDRGPDSTTGHSPHRSKPRHHHNTESRWYQWRYWSIRYALHCSTHVTIFKANVATCVRHRWFDVKRHSISSPFIYVVKWGQLWLNYWVNPWINHLTE